MRTLRPIPQTVKAIMATIQVPVPKAKESLEVDLDKLPTHVYAEALRLGMKELLSRGMTKIATAGLEGDALVAAQQAAKAKAQENLNDCYEGKVRIVGAKAEKTSGEVNTEAMRLARNVIKAAMKAKKIKVSHVKATEITKAAKAYLATDNGKALLEEAKANVEKRKALAAETSIDVSSIPVDEKLVAKAAEEAAAKKAQASAAQAGKPKKRKAKAEATA